MNFCLEEMHNILGESVPEHIMADAVFTHNYNYEKALSYIFEKQGM